MVTTFNALSLVGLVLLAIVFLTAVLSPSVKRVSTWYTYMLAWMVFSVTPFLVVGHQTSLDPPPAFTPCLVDSALMYASRPFAGLATLSLILHLYLIISSRLKQGDVHPHYVFGLGIQNSYQVELEPGGFYCHLANPLPAIVGAAFVGFATSVALLVEGEYIVRACSESAFIDPASHEQCHEHPVSLSIIIRVSVFAILPIIGLGLSFTTYVPRFVDQIFPIYNFLLALLPAAAALIFGSQMDLLRVWMFWRTSHSELKLSSGLTASTSSSVP
ncbi:hypothetical protein B0H17DRAFT_1137830 [Mycena rosella]|uniref:Uncharacterized protein n=1 Tax=Mycena rosella TaxID=1033263 RepID=A0AAD7D889_MYCRO|nr:hypothetical protein B0H17DRAFT_1137830 [Mycena rosella]